MRRVCVSESAQHEPWRKWVLWDSVRRRKLLVSEIWIFRGWLGHRHTHTHTGGVRFEVASLTRMQLNFRRKRMHPPVVYKHNYRLLDRPLWHRVGSIWLLFRRANWIVSSIYLHTMICCYRRKVVLFFHIVVLRRRCRRLKSVRQTNETFEGSGEQSSLMWNRLQFLPSCKAQRKKKLSKMLLRNMVLSRPCPYCHAILDPSLFLDGCVLATTFSIFGRHSLCNRAKLHVLDTDF